MNTPPLRFIPGALIRRLLLPADCIELMGTAMQQVSLGEAVLPLRQGMPLPGEGKALGMMPGYLAAAGERPSLFGIKLVSLFKGNPAAGLPSHLGLYLLYEAQHGQPIAMLDADVITSIRTAAATALATRVLARPDATGPSWGLGSRRVHMLKPSPWCGRCAIAQCGAVIRHGRCTWLKNWRPSFACRSQPRNPLLQRLRTPTSSAR